MFDDILQGQTPLVQFRINGTSYNTRHYILDGIYLNWATFVKTIRMPQGPTRKLFAKCQEAARKDVERAFGVLKSWFAIIYGQLHACNMDKMKDTMLACIILHNKIVENERDTLSGNVDVDYDNVDNDISSVEVSRGAPLTLMHTCKQDALCIQEELINNFKQTWLSIFGNVTVATIMKFDFSLELMCCTFYYQNYVFFIFLISSHK